MHPINHHILFCDVKQKNSRKEPDEDRFDAVQVT
jgi:hypothetical protein